MLNWDLTKEESDLILKIAERANKLYPETSLVFWGMDITATHCNGRRLKLENLLNSDDFNFVHDILGIRGNINRITGKIDNNFLPRYAE